MISDSQLNSNSLVKRGKRYAVRPIILHLKSSSPKGTAAKLIFGVSGSFPIRSHLVDHHLNQKTSNRPTKKLRLVYSLSLSPSVFLVSSNKWLWVHLRDNPTKDPRAEILKNLISSSAWAYQDSLPYPSEPKVRYQPTSRKNSWAEVITEKCTQTTSW